MSVHAVCLVGVLRPYFSHVGSMKEGMDPFHKQFLRNQCDLFVTKPVDVDLNSPA